MVQTSHDSLLFHGRYVLGVDVPAPPAAYGFQVSGGNQRNAPGPPPSWPGTVEAIRDIEENIWCQYFKTFFFVTEEDAK
jgi:hypothetical protein